MKIFSNHAHCIPKSFMPNAEPSDLLKRIDALGIEKSVAFAPFPYQITGENANDWLYARIKNENRLVGFGTVDFNGDVRADVKRAVDYGFKGIKVHPAAQKINILCEPARVLYEQAQKAGLFVTFHTGVHWHRISDYNMLLFDEVARDYPKLNVGLEHFGGYCFFKEALAVLINSPNTYAGMTSISDRTVNKFWYQSDENVNDLLWQVGAGRCIFGLDFPYNSVEQNKTDIKRILDLNITDEEKQLILGGNLEKVLFGK